MFKNITYGPWEIEFDVKRTKEYYYNYIPTEETQMYRNYKCYCHSMPIEEKQFFERFGIDPICCDPISFGHSGPTTFIVEVSYPIFGRIVKGPVDGSDSIEIGNYIISLEIEESCPSNTIVLEANMDELPWLLTEPYEELKNPIKKFWNSFKKNYKLMSELQRHNK